MAAFPRFFGIDLYVCSVKPDLSGYFLSRFATDENPPHCHHDPKRLRKLKPTS